MTTIESHAQYLQQLEAEVQAARADDSFGSASRQLAAFQRLCQETARLTGHAIDALREYSEDEAERFFAQTAQGPDGHIYWLGANRFTRNDGGQRKPARWWWEHRYGTLDQNDVVGPICGERGCISPEHSAVDRRRGHTRRFSDLQMIGALQAAAMRLGRAPAHNTWEGPPSRALYELRFGSWIKALHAAGLKPSHPNMRVSPAACVESLRLARRILGWWPSFDDFRFRPEIRAALKTHELPRSPSTICLHLGGSWPEALRRAGKR